MITLVTLYINSINNSDNPCSDSNNNPNNSNLIRRNNPDNPLMVKASNYFSLNICNNRYQLDSYKDCLSRSVGLKELYVMKKLD